MKQIIRDRTTVTFIVDNSEIRVSIRDGKLRIEADLSIQIVPVASNCIIIDGNLP